MVRGVLTAVLTAVPLMAAPISESDRTPLVQDLERSRTVLLQVLTDVRTEAQWNRKPAPDRWSS